MKKRLFISIVLLTAVVCGAAVFSPHARMALRATKTSHSTQVPVIITVDDGFNIGELEREGVRITGRAGRYLLAQVSEAGVSALSQMKRVRSVDLAHRVVVTNDSARYFSDVEPAHLATDFARAYRGKNVVVGVIDTGVDFNHINLCDSTGETRVERVYMPADTTGVAPVVDGYTLPGSHYTTKEQIKSLTTDYVYSSHGTHTAGTAAGSYIAGGYYGVAPEAKLVICSMPSGELTDINIAHSLQYIFDYAESLGLPAVVNMSLGSCDWAHDGTSPLCQFMDELSGTGKIIVVSAGNDGSKPMHLPHSFVNDADTVRSFLLNYNGGVGYSDFVSTWSDDLTPHNFGLTVANRSTGEIVYRTPMTSEIEADSVLTIFSDTDSILGAYFDGAIQLAAGEESNGKYHSIGVIVGSMTDAAYRVCIELTAPSGGQTHSWAGYSCCFYALGCKGWSNGTSVMSISDMATGDSTISVGAYCSRRTVPAEGGVTTFSRSVPYDIGYFSSYGPDWRGITRPDVVAPGMMVVSSISRYDQSCPPLSTSSPLCLAVGDEYYPFDSMYGTSMSTPVVTGAIALWLEANPNLTPAQIKDVLQNTCYRDSYVTGGDARRWGYGKLDVAQGLHYILANRLRGDVNLDGIVDVTDVTMLINILLGFEPAGDYNADVNEDGTLTVSDVTALITILLN